MTGEKTRFFKGDTAMNAVTHLIIYMKKKKQLLDFDWLRTVQFMCNTRPKSVQITLAELLSERQYELFQANDITYNDDKNFVPKL